MLALVVVGAVWLYLQSLPSFDPDDKRIQRLRIGMTPDEVERVLGRPTGPTTDGDGMQWVWGSRSESSSQTHRIEVYYRDGRVVRVGGDSVYVQSSGPPTFWDRVKKWIGL